MCVGRSADALSETERESLIDHASIVLVPAWSLTRIDGEPALPKARFRTRLRPLHGSRASLPIKPDWAPLVDFIRRRNSPVTIDLVCAAVPSAQKSEAPYVLGPHHHVAIGQDCERAAAEFFCAITTGRPPADGLSSLGLHLLIHSNEPIDPVFASVVGRLALGLPTTPVPVTKNVLFPRDLSIEGVTALPEEAIRAFHPPYGHIEGRGLEGGRPTHIPIRFDPLSDGLALGYAIRQGGREDSKVAVRLGPEDRLKHIYILGKTGSGKTNLLKNLVRQDIAAGHGVCVIDPHGPLVDDALAHVGDRADEVVLLDFSQSDVLPILNPLLVDIKTPRDQELAVEELLDVLIRRSFNEFTGPVFEDTVRMMLSTLSNSAIREHGAPAIAAAVELLRETDARQWVQKVVKDDSTLKQRWITFNSMIAHTVAENVRWVLSKFAEFSPEGVLYPVTGAGGSPLSFEDIFRTRGILLVKLPEANIGRRAAGIIGSIVFSRLHRAARSIPSPAQAPFHIHLDEFQKFVDVDLEEMVAEARKFNLALTFAHQNLRQLDAFSRYEGGSSSRLREAIFSNVGTMISLRTSGGDVPTIAQELGVSESSMRRLKTYSALVRPVVDGVERDPFVLEIPEATTETSASALVDKINKRLLSQGFTRARTDLVGEVAATITSMEDAWRTKPLKPKPLSQKGTASSTTATSSQQTSGSSFLDEWLAKRESRQTEERVPEVDISSDRALDEAKGRAPQPKQVKGDKVKQRSSRSRASTTDARKGRS